MSINSIPNMANAYQKTAGLGPDLADTKSKDVVAQVASDKTDQSAEKTQTSQQTYLTVRQQNQANIVEMMFSTSESATQNSLKITYQEAIDKINDALTAEIGEQVDPNAFLPISQETLDAQGGMEYWTPENTAKRIVEGTTAFLAGYQAAHPELEGEALIDGFMSVIGGGIDQGFDQAKGFLGEMEVLEGEIESNVDTTYKLVQEGLEQFRNQYLGITPTEPETTLDETLTQTEKTES